MEVVIRLVGECGRIGLVMDKMMGEGIGEA